VVAANSLRDRPTRPLPTRSQQLQSLQEEEFDVLVVGGGATGAGCALDSVSRGSLFISYSILAYIIKPVNGNSRFVLK